MENSRDINQEYLQLFERKAVYKAIAVAPGAIDTDIARLWSDETRKRLEKNTVLKRMATPEEIVKAIAFLASEDSRLTTGTVLDVNGGT